MATETKKTTENKSSNEKSVKTNVPTKDESIKTTSLGKTETKSTTSEKVETKTTKKKDKKKERDWKLLNTRSIFEQDETYALRLKNVKKNYGSKKVLRGVTFDIKKGERLALIGKNGAGKSTLINVLAQQTKMSEGEIRYGYASTKVEALERMGIQFQSLNYPEGFIVKDVIKFFNSSVGKNIRMSKKELTDMISMFGIDKYLNQSIDRLSGGQQQRINILLALIKKPHLLILDEISTGLDVESSEVIKGYINQFLLKYPETALLLISHSDEEINEMAERVVVLEAGEIVEDFPSSKLTNKLFLEITSREPKLSKYEAHKAEMESEMHLEHLRKYYFDKKNIVSVREGNVAQEDLTAWQKVITGYEAFKHKFDKVFDSLPNELLDEGNAVELRDVSKTYGKTVGAVRNMSLDIKQGSRIAITGPNGSGKTTIVEIIAQVKKADAQKDKYKNLKSLAKADYDRELKKLEENLNVTIRQQKNLYRLDRELAYNEAKELLKEKNKIDSKDVKAIEAITKKVEKIISDADKAAEKSKLAIEKNEIKLTQEKDDAKLKAKEIFEKKMDFIKQNEQKWKADKSFLYSDEFIMNGTKLPAKEFHTEKEPISYSFADTGRMVRDYTGVQFQYASFPVEMTVLDVLLFFSRTNKFFLEKEEMVNAVKVFKLEKLLKARAYSLSGGERQRLNVLLAIMKSPKLLILDEISTGLDVDSITKIDAFIKEYLDRTNATLILISHNYHEVDSLVDQIVVMKYGKLTEIVDTKGWTTAQTKEKMRDIYKGGGN